ncbi:hypothetical protein [Novosphingobium indicum]|nr:hypothetical protein [Novosphingobium indicum]
MKRLYSLCWMNDGVHWLLLRRDGLILACSPIGFDNEMDALQDLQRFL